MKSMCKTAKVDERDQYTLLILLAEQILIFVNDQFIYNLLYLPLTLPISGYLNL